MESGLAAGALEILDIDVDHRKARDCLEEDITVDALTFEFVPIAASWPHPCSSAVR